MISQFRNSILLTTEPALSNLLKEEPMKVKIKNQPEPIHSNVLHVTMDPTHCCNMRCDGCIEKTAMGKSGRSSLSIETMKSVVNWLANLDNETQMNFYGGECTLHPFFPEILVHAANTLQKGSKIRIVTNGSMLGEQRIIQSVSKASERANLFIRVSINSANSATHEQLHRVPKMFDTIIHGIEAIKKGSQAKIGLSFLVQEENSAEILDCFNLAGKLGADLWIRPKTNPHGKTCIQLSDDAKQKVQSAVQSILTLGKLPSAPKVFIQDWFNKWLKDGTLPDIEKPYSRCYWCLTNQLLITPPEPGHVYFCTYHRGVPDFFVSQIDPNQMNAIFEKIKKVSEAIIPKKRCSDVICNVHEYNLSHWIGD
jgi:organic radical activating enzyme